MACDPWHKIASPTLYRADDAMAAWQRISAPVLMLHAEQGFVNQRFPRDSEEYRRRTGCFAKLGIEWIADAGHNLQHDQPEAVAQALSGFF